MNDEQQIITVKEFRKIAGKEAERFSDEQIIDMINKLNFMAGLFINTQLRKEDLGTEEPLVPNSS